MDQIHTTHATSHGSEIALPSFLLELCILQFFRSVVRLRRCVEETDGAADAPRRKGMSLGLDLAEVEREQFEGFISEQFHRTLSQNPKTVRLLVYRRFRQLSDRVPMVLLSPPASLKLSSLLCV